jgi:hypothetical protein
MPSRTPTSRTRTFQPASLPLLKSGIPSYRHYVLAALLSRVLIYSKVGSCSTQCGKNSSFGVLLPLPPKPRAFDHLHAAGPSESVWNPPPHALCILIAFIFATRHRRKRPAVAATQPTTNKRTKSARPDIVAEPPLGSRYPPRQYKPPGLGRHTATCKSPDSTPRELEYWSRSNDRSEENERHHWHGNNGGRRVE